MWIEISELWIMCLYVCSVGSPTGNVTKDTTSLEGDKVNLMCNATNDIDAPHPVQVKWYKDNQPLIPDGKRVHVYPQRITDDEIQSVLLFNSVYRTDNGVYTCRAFNHHLSYTKLNTNLIVECKLEYSLLILYTCVISDGPEVAIDPSSPQTVSVNDVLQLNCTITGIPTPTLQWKNGSHVVAIKPLYNVTTTFPHTTVYTCVGTNNAGNTQRVTGKSFTVNGMYVDCSYSI